MGAQVEEAVAAAGSLAQMGEELKTAAAAFRLSEGYEIEERSEFVDEVAEEREVAQSV